MSNYIRSTGNFDTAAELDRFILESNGFYKDIAEKAGVSVGTVSNVKSASKKRHYKKKRIRLDDYWRCNSVS